MEQRTITLQFSENDARCLLSRRSSPCRYDCHVGFVDHHLQCEWMLPGSACAGQSAPGKRVPFYTFSSAGART
jgi:hypothetical protein